MEEKSAGYGSKLSGTGWPLLNRRAYRIHLRSSRPAAVSSSDVVRRSVQQVVIGRDGDGNPGGGEVGEEP
jgi:hypothetical protein